MQTNKLTPRSNWVTDREPGGYSRLMAPYPSVARLSWGFRDITDGECIGTGTQRNRRSSKQENQECNMKSVETIRRDVLPHACWLESASNLTNPGLGTTTTTTRRRRRRRFFCWQLLGYVPGGSLFSQLNKGDKRRYGQHYKLMFFSRKLRERVLLKNVSIANHQPLTIPT